MIHAAALKPPPPGPVMCVEVICKPSRPDRRLDRVPPDAPPLAVVRAARRARLARQMNHEWFGWGRR